MESNGIAVPPVDDFGRTWSHAAPARRYKLKDIVNCNEAALVWQAKPVLSCANISGTETKLLLFFERFKTLTAFRGERKSIASAVQMEQEGLNDKAPEMEDCTCPRQCNMPSVGA